MKWPLLLGVVVAAAPLGVFSAEPQFQLAECNGVVLHYTDTGGREEPVVFVHGGVFDLESWAAQAVLAKNYRVVAYSQRYSWPNKNEIQPNYTRVVDAEDLAALITKLNLGPVHVVGASSGGATAVMLAIAHPEMIRSLVLVEPPLMGILWEVPGGEAATKEFDAAVLNPTKEAFAKGDNEVALKIFTGGIWGKRKWTDLSALEQSAIRRNAGAMRARLQAPPGPPPATLKAQLKALRLPTLIVTGENSVALHKWVNDELVRCIPQARQVTIPKSGHTSPHDNPEAFNAELLAFWAATKQ